MRASAASPIFGPMSFSTRWLMRPLSGPAAAAVPIMAPIEVPSQRMESTPSASTKATANRV